MWKVFKLSHSNEKEWAHIVAWRLFSFPLYGTVRDQLFWEESHFLTIETQFKAFDSNLSLYCLAATQLQYSHIFPTFLPCYCLLSKKHPKKVLFHCTVSAQHSLTWHGTVLLRWFSITSLYLFDMGGVFITETLVMVSAYKHSLLFVCDQCLFCAVGSFCIRPLTQKTEIMIQ